MNSTSTTGRPHLVLVEPQPWYATAPTSALERRRELEDERSRLLALPSATTCRSSSRSAPPTSPRSSSRSHDRGRRDTRARRWGRGARRRLRRAGPGDRRHGRVAEHAARVRDRLPRVRRLPARALRRGLEGDRDDRVGRGVARRAHRPRARAELGHPARQRGPPAGRDARRRPARAAGALHPRPARRAARALRRRA